VEELVGVRFLVVAVGVEEGVGRGHVKASEEAAFCGVFGAEAGGVSRGVR
ncbi:uncharacterized protein METZ01_LOCUS451258, partial [marine metagenome]